MQCNTILTNVGQKEKKYKRGKILKPARKTYKGPERRKDPEDIWFGRREHPHKNRGTDERREGPYHGDDIILVGATKWDKNMTTRRRSKHWGDDAEPRKKGE